MNPETNNNSQENHYKLTRKGKIVAGLSAVALTLGLGAGLKESVEDPTMKGDQLVTFGPGDTIDGKTKEVVENGSNYTGLVRIEVKKDPRNVDLKDGVDVGDKAYFPDEVEDE